MSERRKIEGWNELSWGELRVISQMATSGAGDYGYREKLRVWLFINRLEIGMDETSFSFGDDGEMLIPIFRKWKKEEQMSLTRGQLARMVEEDTKWMDAPVGNGDGDGLTILPKETIYIGLKAFKLPEPLLANITYQQYTNAIKLLRATDDIAKEAQETGAALVAQRGKIDKINSMASASKASGLVRHKGLWVKPYAHNKLRLLEREEAALQDKLKGKLDALHKAMARVVSHLLTPRSLSMTREESGVSHISIGWTWAYSPESAERNVGYIRKHAPAYLFGVLSQHLQSCIQVYKNQYPDMFDGDDGGSELLPFLAEADSVNAVMKWQSYDTQQEVYASNAVFVFSILSSMAKESKELERINSKSKAGR